MGVEVESLRGNGSSATAITDNDGQPSVERITSASHISQNKLTLGFSYDLGRRAKWGVFYRYSFISATDRDLSHTLDGSALGLNSTDSSGHSSEIGFRLRGELNPKFFYGFAGSWSGVARTWSSLTLLRIPGLSPAPDHFDRFEPHKANNAYAETERNIVPMKNTEVKEIP